MNDHPQTTTWQRDELLHLLSMSGNMAALCITGVTLFHTGGRESRIATVADDMLAMCALLFLLAAYFIFVALRARSARAVALCERLADGVFIVGMTLMVGAGLVMAYTVW